MMMIFSLYVPILLSLSLSFLLHAFKKHVYSFFLRLVATFKNINTTSSDYHHPISSPPIVTDAIDSPPSQIMFVDEEIGGGVNKLMCCTESLGFESIYEMGADDQIDEIEDHDDIDKGNDNNSNRDDIDEEEDEDEEGCCEGRRDSRELKKSFPPPLSSLNQKGQPSFVLVPTRKNGRLQLSKVRIKRPDILYASREDGRLRLYLVPGHCNDVEEEEEEYEGEEEQKLVEEGIEEEEQEQEKEETIVESEEDEEIIGYEKEEDRVVGDWKFHDIIESFRGCHQVVNQCDNHDHHHHHYHHHHNLHMYGVSIA